MLGAVEQGFLLVLVEMLTLRSAAPYVSFALPRHPSRWFIVTLMAWGCLGVQGLLHGLAPWDQQEGEDAWWFLRRSIKAFSGQV